MNIKYLLICSLVLSLCVADTAKAWGPIGHKVVGGLALDQLDPQAGQRLHDLMGTSDLEQLTDWCNWPDEYRGTDDGAWSTPLHYVNIPQGIDQYDQARDCGQELCVTEAIPRYAAELADTELDREQRQRAFGFLCHFVGDLSQSLHAGFGHDRGGNLFIIQYDERELNLHEFWDHTLIEEHADHWLEIYESIGSQDSGKDKRQWDPALSVKWTNESHLIARSRAYPDNSVISPEFTDQSWHLIRQQLGVGGRNLALILNSVFGSQCTRGAH